MDTIEMIDHKTLSELAAQNLRKAIITGNMVPGQRITETGISQSMNVSRVVVREAFLMLLREGLIIKERNRYTQVVRLDIKDVADLYDLRIAIEQAAAKRCIQGGKASMNALMEELCTLAKSIGDIQQTPGYDKVKLLHMDISFHNTIVKRSENARLLNVWEEISGPLLVSLYRYISNGSEFSYSHGEIIQALSEADEALVCREIFEHIEDTKQVLIRSF